MKKTLLMVIVALSSWTDAMATGFFNNEPMTLDVPEMSPEVMRIINQDMSYDLDIKMLKHLGEADPENVPLVRRECLPFVRHETDMEANAKMDFDFFKSKTADDVKPYKVMDDLTFVGVPLFVAGWAIKGDKAMFRVNNKDGKKNTQLLTDFKTGIDDYTQFFGPVMTVGLKLGGYEGRSDWPRLMASSLMSYAIMAGFVNGIKYTAKEMRPDGSTANSWPSGHTATSFVGAAILHKEYGLTRSPWFSVAGYGVATATGVMRVLNNRHWVSDVMSGAGIGIMSTELGYAIGDLLFKRKGLLRNDMILDSEKPSFFGISMGLGLGGKDIDFNYFTDMQDKELHGMTEEIAAQGYDLLGDAADINIDFRSATVVDAEGAYFFNKYVGVGGRFRVRAMSAKSFGKYADISSEDYNSIWTLYIDDIYKLAGNTLNMADVTKDGASVTNMQGIVKSDHLAEFTGSVGLYLNLPLNKHFALGTKFLIGRSITQELDIDGHVEGNVKDIKYYMLIEDGKVYKGEEGGLAFAVEAPVSTGETYTDDWDYIRLGSDNSTSYGTGISLTYRYKSNFSWKLFCDYDYSEKTYTMTVDECHYVKKALGSSAYNLVSSRLTASDGTPISSLAYELEPYVFKKDKKMNYFTVGLSFAVNF